MKDIVAIVGRPNVGKSTLFNKLIGDRISIVKNEPGVTRDRLYHTMNWSGKDFILIDTGGLEPRSNEFMMTKIIEQAKIAISEANVIIFLVNGKDGITSIDEDIANILRKEEKKVIVAVNKIDNYTKDLDKIYEFYSLGFENVIGISAEHKINLGDMLDEVVDKFNKNSTVEEEGLKISVLGRPNAGKSSFVNKILNEERNIVSNIAGTTRDSIDSPFKFDGERYVLIDTAGIRRKNKIDDSIEYYSILRAIKSVKRSDVCVLMLDATELVTEQDKRIAGILFDEKKPIIIAINKWDLIEKNNSTLKEFTEKIKSELPFISYAPVIAISALTGQRSINIVMKAKEIFEYYKKEINTGLLNQVLNDILKQNPVPTRKGRSVKINYVTQTGTKPPTFAFYTNNPELIHFSYERYLQNKFREYFGFEGVPIEFIFNKKNNSFF